VFFDFFKFFFLNFSPKISNFFNSSVAHHGARHVWMDGMLWRIWEKHGSCGNPVWLIFEFFFCFFKQMCSAWWLVVLCMAARSSTWWLSSLLAHPGFFIFEFF